MQAVLQWDTPKPEITLSEQAFKRLDRVTRSTVSMNSTLNYFIKAELVNLSKVKGILDALMLESDVPFSVSNSLASMRESLENSITLGEQVRRIAYDMSEASALNLATLTLAVRDKWLSQLPEHKVSTNTLSDLRFAPLSQDLFDPVKLVSLTDEIKARRGEILHEQWEAAATIDALKRTSKLAGLDYKGYKIPNKKQKGASNSSSKPPAPASAGNNQQLAKVQAQLTQAKAELSRIKNLKPTDAAPKRGSQSGPSGNKPNFSHGKGRGKKGSETVI